MTHGSKITEVRSEQWDPNQGRQVFTYKITQLIWWLLGILEGLLAIRFLLKLIGANPSSPIASLIYTFTGLFLIPFRGLTPTPSAEGFVFEISTLIAMIIYGLLGWAIERLIWLVFYHPRGTTVEITETKSQENPSQHHLPSE